MSTSPSPGADPSRRAALITGASRGIGRAIAVHLARLGWDVGVNFLSNREAAAQTRREAESLGARAVLCPGDVAVGQDRDSMLRVVRKTFGRIDALVNNAGVSAQRRVDLLDMEETSYDRVLGTNLKGPHFLCRDTARWMLQIRQEWPDRALHIVNISSISEYAVSIHRGEYCIAKAGLGMLTRLYAQRLGPHGIQVNEVRPGVISTDMTAGVREKYDRLIADGFTPIRRWGEPGDVARAVGALVEGHFPFTTGAAFDVDGGFHIRSL